MEISVRVGATLNLGNYQSLRMDVESGDGVIGDGVTRHATLDDVEAKMDAHYALLEDKLMEKLGELYQRLVNEGLVE